MSLEDLERFGFLLPEERWSDDNRRVTASPRAVAPVAIVGLVGCVAIGLGDGGWPTWLGVVLYLAGLFAFLAVNVGAIGRRRRSR